jgi:hypothetical protein
MSWVGVRVHLTYGKGWEGRKDQGHIVSRVNVIVELYVMPAIMI